MWEYGIHLVAAIVVYLYCFGFIWGTVYFILSIHVFDKVISYFGYERMRLGDTVLAYAEEHANSNI